MTPSDTSTETSEPTEPPEGAEITDDMEPSHTRRRALRLAGAGLIGVAAASAIAETAAADDGITLTPGVPTATTEPVRTVFQGTAGNVGYLFESGTSGGSNASTFPAVVGAWARPTGQPVHGIYAFTARTDGAGVVAEAAGTGGIGVDARGASHGVVATGETGVLAKGNSRGLIAEAEGLGSVNIAIRAQATGRFCVGMFARGDGDNAVALAGQTSGAGNTIGVSGAGAIGGSFRSSSAGGTGVEATGFRYGAMLSGGQAPLRLEPGGTAPPTQTVSHERGEVAVDSTGDAWVCVATGTPGTWRKLAGTSTAGAFHAIEPARVYDSRRDMAPTADGVLVSGQNRLIPVSDRRNVDTGAVDGVAVVPAGTTAIAYNVTVTATSGTGYLYVAPGSATAVAASTINWDVGNQGAIANAAVVAVDANRAIRVFAGGRSGAQAHVIIDISGYYR